MTASRGLVYAALASIAVVVGWHNAVGLEWLLRWALFYGFVNNDWSLFVGLDPAQPYVTPGFHWMVPAAWLWVYVVQPLGFGAWSVLHLAALLTIRRPLVIVAALVTVPFWQDVVSGNMVTFAFVAAWHALHGSRTGIVAFCVITALVPRPLMIPVLAWLLWRSGPARYAFGVSLTVVGVMTLATGQLGPLLGNFLDTPQMGADFNLAPSLQVGWAWVAVAWPLAAFAWWRGRLGFASVLASPYWIGYYLLFALLELRQPVRPQAEPAPVRSVPAEPHAMHATQWKQHPT